MSQFSRQNIGFSYRLILLVCFVTGVSTISNAWDKHSSYTRYWISDLPESYRNQKAPVICPSSEQTRELAIKLQVNLQHFEALPSHQECNKLMGQSVRIEDYLFQYPLFDEPDRGIDEDLPDEADPKSERLMMGGKTGANSRGFRHMFFPGWNYRRPILSFQLPLHETGQAKERIQTYVELALSRKANSDLLGAAQAMSWAAHYIQDLTQPFHTSQIADLRMAAWSQLWAWPPKLAISQFITETTRIVSNYHSAFESLTAGLLEHNPEFAQSCARGGPSRSLRRPEDLLPFINDTIQTSHARAEMLVPAVIDAVGDEAKNTGVNLAAGTDTAWVSRDSILAKRPSQLDTLEKHSCDLVGEVASRTLALFRLLIEN